MVVDHHVHTQFAGLNAGNAFDIADRAIDAHLQYLGFAENLPLPAQFLLDIDGEDFMPADDLPHYLDTVEAVKADGRSRGLTVLAGLEVDYLPQFATSIGRKLQRVHEHLDFRLLGLHFLGTYSIGFSRPTYEALLQDRYGGPEGMDELFLEYYGTLLEGVKTGWFDIVGHFDLAKKFTGVPGDELALRYPGPIRRVLRAMRAEDVALEVNLSGLRSYCQEVYPAPQIIRWAVDEGIPLTLCSDATTDGHLNQ